MTEPARSSIPWPNLDEVAQLPAPPQAFQEHATVQLSDHQLLQLSRYVGLLGAANQLAALTAVRSADEIWMRLVLDSLTLASVLSGLPAGARAVDVGSGGGVPGIPLAITHPNVRFTLVEATAKKASFLKHIAQSLELPNLDVLQGRAETLAAHTPRGDCRERFDFVTARALAPLPTLLELTLPFAKAPQPPSNPGGAVVLVKGERAQEELESAKNALRVLYAEHVETTRTATGSLLSFRKLRVTPNRFPRGNNQPKKSPI